MGIRRLLAAIGAAVVVVGAMGFVAIGDVSAASTDAPPVDSAPDVETESSEPDVEPDVETEISEPGIEPDSSEPDAVETGTIIVQNVARPESTPQEFAFRSNAGNFTLLGTSRGVIGPLAAGNYTVTESVPEGWDLTSATCDDGSSPDAIALEAGETVTCTFTNIERGLIVITKETEPAGSTVAFAFDSSFGTFRLADGESKDSGLVEPGTYSVSESAPAGWAVSSATCDNGNTPDAIVLEPGATVTCAFQNTLQGRIVVNKVTDPAMTSDEFDFTTTYGQFTLGDGGSNESGDLKPGTYSVTEVMQDDWSLSSAVCDDGSSANAIDLASGETVTCTFTNTQKGRILVKKETDPAGSSQEFSFTSTYPGSTGFTLSAGGTDDSGPLAPGSYSVSESPPDGWDLTSATCDDGSAPDDIEVGVAETVTCTFVNTERGHIVVEKATQPAGALEQFSFSTSYGDDFDLTDGASDSSTALPVGQYSVNEAVPSGWDVTSATCDDGSSPDAIDLQPAETVTCTFTNAQRGQIVVRKATDPSGATQQFPFTTSYADDFSLTDGTEHRSRLLRSGSYAITESVPDGWVLNSATCDDGSATDAIDLEPGETVTCTFTASIQRSRSGGLLPRTGGSIMIPIGVAVGLVGAGVILVSITLRRRRNASLEGA